MASEIRTYRMVRRARLVFALAGLVIAVIGFLMVGMLGVLVGVVVGGVLYFWSAAWGCTCTPESFIIDSVGHKKLAWSEIQGVDYSISRLATTATIVDQRGKVWILRAPTTSAFTPDPLMKKKMTEIENYWKTHRGASWTPNRDIQSALKPWARIND